MFEINTLLFLAVVALGAMVQTLTGFAMGLITMAGVAVLGIADIAFSAAVVSFVSFVNALVALRQGYRQVDWQLVRWVVIGLLPAMVCGIALLAYLSENHYNILRLLLGFVIILAGSLLMISPAPFTHRSGRFMQSAAGVSGGLLAGLYSAGGAPLAYFMYRQPVALNVIRFSLLAIFAITTSARSVMVGVFGQLNMNIMVMSAVAVPLVIVVTLATARLTPHVPDRLVRLLVFFVLLVVGGILIFGGRGLAPSF